MEQTYINRDPLYGFIGTGYEYDRLRSDPRFVDLMKGVGMERGGQHEFVTLTQYRPGL